MTFKTLLLGSAAACCVLHGAQAADAIVAAEPEPMEYVRVCDAYGVGYFYIPGTETCLKIGGYVRYDSNFGESPYTDGNVGWQGLSRGTIQFDARNETEYGTLRSFIEQRFDATADGTSSPLISAYIEIAGLRAGYTDSRFDTWLNSAGNIINDDVIDYTGDRTNQVSYVYKGANGFSALVGVEEGDGQYDTGDIGDPIALYRADDVPHLIAGAKIEEDWGGIAGIVGYDGNAEAIGAKLRLDIVFNDVFSGFIMGGYQSDWDNDNGPGGSRERNYYGPWNGDWAAWGGLSAKINEKATINSQAAYEQDGTFAAALNVQYTVVKGLFIQPEFNFTRFDGTRGNGEAYGGTLRVQRDF